MDSVLAVDTDYRGDRNSDHVRITNMNDDKPETNKSVIFIVVFAIAICAVIGVLTLSYCLVAGKELNQTLLTLYSALVTGLFGYLSGVLSKTSPTATTSQVTVQDQPTLVPPTPEPKQP